MVVFSVIFEDNRGCLSTITITLYKATLLLFRPHAWRFCTKNMSIVHEPLSLFDDCAHSVAIWLNGNEKTHTICWDRIWNKANARYCTDGAANNIMKRMMSHQLELPCKIVGDFDSINANVKKELSDKAKVIEAKDQDRTDMTKCMEIVNDDILDAKEVKRVVVLGGFSGRFDHTLASLNSLLTTGLPSKVPYYALDDINLVFVLNEGNHRILLDRSKLTGICGFVPFCQRKTVVNTKGFKWNVDGPLEFSGLISTSNHLDADEVNVNTTAPLIFTLELKRSVIDS